MTDAVWGVEVSESRIFTYSGTADPDRWVFYRSRYDGTGRITVLEGFCLVGEVVHVAALSRDDAGELHDMLLGWGIHKSAIKVRRLRRDDVSTEEWATLTGYVERLSARHGQADRPVTS